MILCKSSVLLEDEHYAQILNLSWELLLDRNEELAACAGKNGQTNCYFFFHISSSFLSNNCHFNCCSCWSFSRRLISQRNGQSIGINSLQCNHQISNTLAISISILDSFRRRRSFDDEGKHSFSTKKKNNSNFQLDPSAEYRIRFTFAGTRRCQSSNGRSALDATCENFSSASRFKSRGSRMLSICLLISVRKMFFFFSELL